MKNRQTIARIIAIIIVVAIAFSVIAPLAFAKENTSRAQHTVNGIVWMDENRNGIREKGDEGIFNVTVRLMRDTSVLFESKTDENGQYRFESVLAGGPYQVQVIPPKSVNGRNYVVTLYQKGDDRYADSDIKRSTNKSDEFLLEGDTRIDCGYYLSGKDAVRTPGKTPMPTITPLPPTSSPTPTITTSPTPAPSPNLAAKVGMIIGEEVCVYETYTNGSIIATLAKNALVIVAGNIENARYPVLYGSITGYIDTDKLHITDRKTILADSIKTSLLRQKPSMAALPILRIASGHRVEVIGVSTAYLNIRVGHFIGFAPANHFILNDATQYYAIVIPPPGYYKASLMSAPTGGKVIKSYSKNTRVYVLEMGKSRHKVRVNGLEGYMAVNFLRPEEKR